MATVEVRFAPLAAHVRTARLVASAVARRCGVAPELLDEVRFAVGEACARAVKVHQRFASMAAVTLKLAAERDALRVTVTDVGPAALTAPAPNGAEIGSGVYDPILLAAAVPRQTDSTEAERGDAPLDLLPEGFGLAVIRGLVDDIAVLPAEDGAGTTVRMSWPIAARRTPLPPRPRGHTAAPP